MDGNKRPMLISSSNNGQTSDAGVPISLFAFGHPSEATTFSGYSLSLANALRGRGLLKSEYSIKQISPFDIISGAFELKMISGRPKLKIKRSWMWGRSGNKTLSDRLHQKMKERSDNGPFLQVGTLVTVPDQIGAHFVLTDMTIPQAKRVGHFDISKLSDEEIKEAVDVQKAVFENARSIFTLSEWTRQSVLQDFNISGEKVVVVYAGSNLSIPPGLSEPRIPHEILFVGIDWKRKGGELLVEAFRLLREKMPDATLTIVGCSPEINEPGVKIEGFLARSDAAEAQTLARCYLRASCFCLPSFFDPFPNALIEAASVGLPAVAIDNGSRREAIIDGETGKLISKPDARELAEALYWVLENEDRRTRLSSTAIAHAEAHFTWERVIDRIENVIAQKA